MLINPYVFGDPYFSNVSLLLHGDGANNTNSFADSSSSPKAVNAVGNVKNSTAQSKFGGASIAFDGNGDYLQILTSDGFDLGSFYTIEFWMRANTFSVSAGLVHRGFYTTTNGSWDGFSFSIRLLDSSLRFYYYAGLNAAEQFVDVATSGNMSINTWHHVAMVRNNNNGIIFIDGVSKGTISALNLPSSSSRALLVGVWAYSANNEWFNGYIDDLRITKGVARYLYNFTPPSSPFPDR